MRLGDLDALKAEVVLMFGDKTHITESVCELIDNAPTVTPDKIQAIMSDYFVYRCEPQRPQGEWIAREDMDYLDENKVVHNHFECNKCGLIHDFVDGHTAQYNFCPQCGVAMQNEEVKKNDRQN